MFQYLRYQHHFSIFSDCVLFPVVWHFDWVCLFMTGDACFERDVMDNWFFFINFRICGPMFCIYMCSLVGVFECWYCNMIRFDMSFDSNSNVFNYCLCWISINIVYKKKGKIPKKQSQVQDKPYKKKKKKILWKDTYR